MMVAVMLMVMLRTRHYSRVCEFRSPASSLLEIYVHYFYTNNIGLFPSSNFYTLQEFIKSCRLCHSFPVSDREPHK